MFSVEIVSRIFNHIDDPKDFQVLSTVCKEWQDILNNHVFWKHLVKDLKLSKSKNQTYKLTLIKNIDKLCFCKRHHHSKIKPVKKIYARLDFIRGFCERQYDWFNALQYKLHARYVSDEIKNILRYECEGCEEDKLKKIILKLKNDIYGEKKILEERFKRSFSPYIIKSFINILVNRLHLIVINKEIEIGGAVV